MKGTPIRVALNVEEPMWKHRTWRVLRGRPAAAGAWLTAAGLLWAGGCGPMPRDVVPIFR